LKSEISLAVLFLVISCSVAQNRPSSMNETISLKDDANIVHEYLQATDAKAKMLKIQEIMIAQMQNSLGRMLAEKLNSSSFEDQSSRSAAALLVNDAISNFVERFGKEQRKLMPFEDLEQNIIGPIIRKHFSNDELIKLIAFYKSPVGKKYIDSVDSIMLEISTKTNQEYGHRVYSLSKSIAEEELGNIQQQLMDLHNK
jgi:hypothetical protein